MSELPRYTGNGEVERLDDARFAQLTAEADEAGRKLEEAMNRPERTGDNPGSGQLYSEEERRIRHRAGRGAVDALREAGMPAERWILCGEYGYLLHYDERASRGWGPAFELYRAPRDILASYPPEMSTRDMQREIGCKVNWLEEQKALYKMFSWMWGFAAIAWILFPLPPVVAGMLPDVISEVLPRSPDIHQFIMLQIIAFPFFLIATAGFILSGGIWNLPLYIVKCFRGRGPAGMRAANRNLFHPMLRGTPEKE